MKNFDAGSDGVLPLYCFTCEKEIPGGIWFARIPLENCRVAFCRPRCVELFLDHREKMSAKLHPQLTTLCDVPAINAKELATHGEQVSGEILNWTREYRW